MYISPKSKDTNSEEAMRTPKLISIKATDSLKELLEVTKAKADFR